jgi:hypothetical protein
VVAVVVGVTARVLAVALAAAVALEALTPINLEALGLLIKDLLVELVQTIAQVQITTQLEEAVVRVR